MTWYADLTPYEYLCRDRPDEQTRNVGWLDATHPFPTGEVPSELVARLNLLVEHGRTQGTMGPHACELCARDGIEPFRQSAEIRAVAADGLRYAAPTMITHYITRHHYVPPQAFIDAVLRMQHIDWETARVEKRCLSCGTQMTPVNELADRGFTFLWLRCSGCETSYCHVGPTEMTP